MADSANTTHSKCIYHDEIKSFVNSLNFDFVFQDFNSINLLDFRECKNTVDIYSDRVILVKMEMKFLEKLSWPSLVSLVTLFVICVIHVVQCVIIYDLKVF